MDERPRRSRRKGKPISGMITAILIVSVVIVLGLMIWVFSGDLGISSQSSNVRQVVGGDAMSSSVAMDRRTAIAVKQMAASIATDT